MKKIFIIFSLIIFSVKTVNADEFRERLAAIGQPQEQDGGYTITVALDLFNNNPANIEIVLSDISVNIIGHYQEVDTNIFGSVTKTFTPKRTLNIRKAEKKHIENQVVIFIPYDNAEDVIDETKNSAEEDLLKAKENFEKNREKGFSFVVTAETRGRSVNAKVFYKGKFVRTEMDDGSYMINGKKHENGSILVIWYNSKDNIHNIQKLDDDMTFEEMYIDNPENYKFYIKGEDISTYSFPCTMYSKTDVNEIINACINIESGMILSEEKVGKYKKIIKDVSIDNVTDNAFDIPTNAVLMERF